MIDDWPWFKYLRLVSIFLTVNLAHCNLPGEFSSIKNMGVHSACLSILSLFLICLYKLDFDGPKRPLKGSLYRPVQQQHRLKYSCRNPLRGDLGRFTPYYPVNVIMSSHSHPNLPLTCLSVCLLSSHDYQLIQSCIAFVYHQCYHLQIV